MTAARGASIWAAGLLYCTIESKIYRKASFWQGLRRALRLLASNDSSQFGDDDLLANFRDTASSKTSSRVEAG